MFRYSCCPFFWRCYRCCSLLIPSLTECFPRNTKHLQLAVVRSIDFAVQLVNNNFTCNCFIHCIKRIVHDCSMGCTNKYVRCFCLLYGQLEIANEQCWKCWDEQIDTKTLLSIDQMHALSLSLYLCFFSRNNDCVLLCFLLTIYLELLLHVTY